jgi:Phosphate-starvation-inducible E family
MPEERGIDLSIAKEAVAERPGPAGRFKRYCAAMYSVLRNTRAAWPLLTAYERFEQVVSLVLAALVSVLVLATLVHLTYRILRLVLFALVDPVQQEFFQAVFGMVMTVLIALEFNHSILSVLERR